MKTCCLCGTNAPKEQATCRACGEATWAAIVQDSELSDATSADPPRDEPAAAPRKRGRR